MRNDVTMKFEIYEIENDKENSGENIRNNKVDNKVDNINLKFEVYECVRGGMQQTTPGAIDSFEYPVMKVPNTSYFNIINLGIINIILIKMLHCMALMMLLLTQCREFSVRLTLITMKLKLNLFKKLTNEDKHIMTIVIDLIGCVLFVVALCYGIYWCLTSWLLS